MFTNPSVQDFKDQFSRDFMYGTDPNTTVTDADIAYAFQMVNFNINQCLFANQGQYTVAYNLLAAHYLVLNIRSSSQGLNGQYNFPEASKSVGSVSVAFSIPDRINDNPYWSMLMGTNYGAQYLQLILPQLAGAMTNAFGTTLP